jgi:hypothetical protein
MDEAPEVSEVAVTPTKPSSRAKRRKARETKAARDLRFFNLLAMGIPLPAIAHQERLPARRMREIMDSILARRSIAPLAGHFPLQIQRLGDALGVAYGGMMDGDIRALDRVLKIVKEIDRYRGMEAQLVARLNSEAAPTALIANMPPARSLPAPEDVQIRTSCALKD